MPPIQSEPDKLNANDREHKHPSYCGHSKPRATLAASVVNGRLTENVPA